MEEGEPSRELKRRPLWPDGGEETTVITENTKQQFLKLLPSRIELAISALFHAGVLGYYAFGSMRVVEPLRHNKEAMRLMMGPTEFGGQWKYLTFINQRIQISFFMIALLADIFPWIMVRQRLKQLSDYAFISLVFPLTMIVSCTFWSLYAIDRELVYPSVLDKHVPYILNHICHTFILPIMIAEALLVFHRHPSNKIAISTLVVFLAAYTGWVLIIFNETGHWVYSFLKFFSPLGFIAFSAAVACVGCMFLLVGKGVSKINPYWRARHNAITLTF